MSWTCVKELMDGTARGTFGTKPEILNRHSTVLGTRYDGHTARAAGLLLVT